MPPKKRRAEEAFSGDEEGRVLSVSDRPFSRRKVKRQPSTGTARDVGVSMYRGEASVNPSDVGVPYPRPAYTPAARNAATYTAAMPQPDLSFAEVAASKAAQQASQAAIEGDYARKGGVGIKTAIPRDILRDAVKQTLAEVGPPPAEAVAAAPAPGAPKRSMLDTWKERFSWSLLAKLVPVLGAGALAYYSWAHLGGYTLPYTSAALAGAMRAAAAAIGNAPGPLAHSLVTTANQVQAAANAAGVKERVLSWGVRAFPSISGMIEQGVPLPAPLAKVWEAVGPLAWAGTPALLEGLNETVSAYAPGSAAQGAINVAQGVVGPSSAMPALPTPGWQDYVPVGLAALQGMLSA